MANQKLFSVSRAIRWPTEFKDIVDMLRGVNAAGEVTHAAMYRFNTGPIVLAAMVGLFHKRERDVGSKHLDINSDTFEAHKFGSSSLSAFILLVPLLGTQDLELLRPDREDELVQTFERYAAGGLEYLRGALSMSADLTGQAVIKAEIQRALKAIPHPA